MRLVFLFCRLEAIVLRPYGSESAEFSPHGGVVKHAGFITEAISPVLFELLTSKS